MRKLVRVVEATMEYAEIFGVREEAELQLAKVSAEIMSNVIASKGKVVFESNNTAVKTVEVVKEVEVKVEDTTKIKELESMIELLNKEKYDLIGEIENLKQLLAESEKEKAEMTTPSKHDYEYITNIKRRESNPDVVYGTVQIGGKDMFFEAGQMNAPLVYGASALETLAIRDELNRIHPNVLGTGDGDIGKLYTNIDGYDCYMSTAETGKILGYIGDFCFFWSPEENDLPFIKRANLNLVKTSNTKLAGNVSCEVINELGLYDIAKKLLSQYRGETKVTAPKTEVNYDYIDTNLFNDMINLQVNNINNVVESEADSSLFDEIPTSLI